MILPRGRQGKRDRAAAERFCRDPISAPSTRTALAIALVLIVGNLIHSAGSSSWHAAGPGYGLTFPRDHAAHPDYKIEWWYYTGNVQSLDGRHFGYQLTFFRVGVDFKPVNPSRWAVRDLFMTHIAVTDVEGAKFLFCESLNRTGPGWAGAASDFYHVWNGHSEVRLDALGRHVLHGSDGPLALDLTLTPLKPPSLNGIKGLSQKGSQPGNATYYYSITRMSTTGRLVLNGTPIDVNGLTWMDHEFGTSFLEPDQIGWDWFSMQLDDGTDLMLFELRRKDGSRDLHSSGSVVDTRGVTTALNAGEFELTPGRSWHSEATGAEYPIEWRIELPGQGLQLLSRAVVLNQEFRAPASSRVNYWEGAIELSGSRAGHPIHGRGYLEMTGYTGPGMGSWLR